MHRRMSSLNFFRTVGFSPVTFGKTPYADTASAVSTLRMDERSKT